MPKELEVVVLTRDLPEHRLEAGDVGTVVHVHSAGEAYEVEFVRAEGSTVAVLTLSAADVRLMTGQEILHARKLAS
jgi:hypothetical protein